ncbi:MAG: hypothetical protein AAF845_10520 [Bacteroidota bacterium]
MIAYAPPIDHHEAPADEQQAIYAPLEGPVWAVVAVGVILGLLSANPLLTAASILTLPILVTLLWRRGEIPILLFAVGYQWLQVSAKIFQANLLDVPVSVISLTPTVDLAIWLGLLAVVTLAVGMRLALRTFQWSRSDEATREAWVVPLSKAAVFYIVCALMAVGAKGAAWVVPGVHQIAIALEGFKWIGFYVLAYVALTQRSGYLLLAGATVFEFVQGIGFFSGFKTVVFVLILAFFTASRRIDGRALGFGLAGLAGLLVIGSAWTVVKTDYRAFLNQGSGMQETVVSEEEQLAKLAELVTNLSFNDIGRGFDPLLRRVAYVDFFAASMDYVPTVVAHQEGRVWLEALQNLVPRLLYPDKPVLVSDSEHTMQYTGFYLASDTQGTSISLGYVADSYIDFGPIWMFGPILILGFLWGLMYRYFMSRSGSALLGFAFSLAVLLVAYQYEIAAVKLVAGIVVKFLVLAVILRLFEERIREFLGITDHDLSLAYETDEEDPEPSHA